MKKTLYLSFVLTLLITLFLFGVSLNVKRTEGEASAVFEVPSIFPEYENNGFRQSIHKDNNSTIAEVTVSYSPLMSRTPLPRIKSKSSKEKFHISGIIAGKSEREIDAVAETIRYLRSNIEYSNKPDDPTKPLDVISSKKGNCLGIANAMCAILSSLGIESRIVYGLRFPSDSKELELKGGAIHAWVEVNYPDVGCVFSDPRWGINGVSENYIVLSLGNAPTFDFLNNLKGERIKLLKKAGGLLFDRVLDKEGESIIFERPNIASVKGSTLAGKFITESGSRLDGVVSLSSQIKRISIPISDNGFIFENLEPGEYIVSINTKNSTIKKSISIAPYERINLTLEMKE